MGLYVQLKCQPALPTESPFKNRWQGGWNAGNDSWWIHGIIGVKK